jgi:DNA-binding NarL/FixJ family response regulator
MNDMGESEGVPECLLFGEAMQSDISARDLVEVLSSKLPAQSRAVLECLADGLGAREVGRKLKLSHTMVIKHRRRIASLFTRLDQTCGAERLKAG